jgi:hypothetical protein
LEPRQLQLLLLPSSNTKEPATKKRRTPVHETIHMQSLLLGLAFLAVWSPNNLLAPNLTQIAKVLNMTTEERDMYLLGSYCALPWRWESFPCPCPPCLDWGRSRFFASQTLVFWFASSADYTVTPSNDHVDTRKCSTGVPSSSRIAIRGGSRSNVNMIGSRSNKGRHEG